MFTSLLAGDGLTANSLLQLSNQQTRSIVSHHRLLTGYHWSSLAHAGRQLTVTATAADNSLYSLGSDQKNTVSNICFIGACLFVVGEICLSSRYQAMAVFVSHHVTIHLVQHFIGLWCVDTFWKFQVLETILFRLQSPAIQLHVSVRPSPESVMHTNVDKGRRPFSMPRVNFTSKATYQ
jgi:hypothetical protein